MVEFDKPSLLKVLYSINNEYEEKKIDRHILDKNFDAFWNEFDNNIQKVKQEFIVSSTPIVHRDQSELTEEILSLVRDISSRNFTQDFKSKVLQDAMKRHMGTITQLYNDVKRLNDRALLGYAINLFGTYYKVYDEFDIEDNGKSKVLLLQYKNDLVAIYKDLTGDDLSIL